MENKFLMDLVQKLSLDTEFRKQLFNKETLDEMYEFASNSISGYNKEEFAEVIKAFESVNIKNGNLSEDELDKVSGGSVFFEVLSQLPGLFQNLSIIFKKLATLLKKPNKKTEYNELLKGLNITQQEADQIIQNPNTDPQKAAIIMNFINSNS